MQQEKTPIKEINKKTENERLQLKVKNELIRLEQEGLLLNPILETKNYNPNIPNLSNLLEVVQKTINIINLHGDKNSNLKSYNIFEERELDMKAGTRIYATPGQPGDYADSAFAFDTANYRAIINHYSLDTALEMMSFETGVTNAYKTQYSVRKGENPEITYYSKLVAEDLRLYFTLNDARGGDRLEIIQGGNEIKLNLETGKCRTVKNGMNLKKWHLATEEDIDSMAKKYQQAYDILKEKIYN